MGKYELISLRKRYRREENLVKIIPFMLIGFSVLFSLFFFSFNLTGNITDSPYFIQDGNIIGAVFFLVGLVGLFLHLKRSNLE
jgi:uncharacterized membrane protein